jgi:hypothetical protein
VKNNEEEDEDDDDDDNDDDYIVDDEGEEEKEVDGEIKLDEIPAAPERSTTAIHRILRRRCRDVP